MTWPQAQLPAVPSECIKSEGPLFHTAQAELPDVDKSNGAHVPLQELFGIGAKILCVASFEKAGRPAEVVDVRVPVSDTDADEEALYYVHYQDCDKRLDEWIPASKVVMSLSGPPAGPEVRPMNACATASDFNVTAMASDQKMTRHKKRRHDDIHHVGQAIEELAPIDQHLELQHQAKTKVKNIDVVELGAHEINTWYYSPYPEPWGSQQQLWVCEFDMLYFKNPVALDKHLVNVTRRSPPGKKIYQSPNKGEETVPGSAFDTPVAVFEVDGKEDKVYCQALCLFSKLFLDHKTLYYDVDPFLFYVFCEVDQNGCHPLGYFSKEKNSAEGYNLACILTLPPYQRKGYGKFLIGFSYELSKKEAKIGTPERPLSDLGHVSYRSYWTRVVLQALEVQRGNLSVKDISELTAIRADDIVKTLESLSLIKYWKGDHIISVTPRIIEEHLRTVCGRAPMEVDPSCITWDPWQLPPPAKRATA